MKAPPLFIPVTLVFWGYQAGLIWISLLMASAVLWGSRSNRKYDFEPEDFNKFVDVSIILVAAAIVIGFTIEARTAIWFLIKWLPVCLYPVIMAQLFSSDSKIFIRSFLLAARRNAFAAGTNRNKIDISYIYAFTCLFCAGMIPAEQLDRTAPDYPLYFLVTAILMVWALWQIRCARYPLPVWGVLICSMIGLGFFGHKAVRMTGHLLRDWVIGRYSLMGGQSPFRSYTALGQIGQLKLSGRIVLRAALEDPQKKEAFYLQTAVYNRFSRNVWISKSAFQPVEASGEPKIWRINPQVDPVYRMTIYQRPVKNRVMLSLPAGTTQIANLKTGVCTKNSLQAVRLDEAPPWIAAVVEYAGSPMFDAPPSKIDLTVPGDEQETLRQVNAQLGLASLRDKDKAARIRRYFLDRFTYTLELLGKGDDKTPLQHFLLRTRKGHCELFATAAVLLMRDAGIPARYVTGYLVSEYSSLEGRFLVRSRDAHTWARIYVDGRWQDWDTTPPGFTVIDEQFVSTSRLSDLLSYLGFHAMNLRYETGQKFLETYGLLLVLPLGLMLWFRLRQTSRIKRVEADIGKPGKIKADRLQESFYLLESYFNLTDRARRPHETYPAWIQRIRHETWNDALSRELSELLHLHNRMVFGPGIRPDEKKYLFDRIRQLIAEDRDTGQKLPFSGRTK